MRNRLSTLFLIFFSSLLLQAAAGKAINNQWKVGDKINLRAGGPDYDRYEWKILPAAKIRPNPNAAKPNARAEHKPDIIIVLDVSKSMDFRLKINGKNRPKIVWVQEQFKDYLAKIPNDTRVYILAFNSHDNKQYGVVFEEMYEFGNRKLGVKNEVDAKKWAANVLNKDLKPDKDTFLWSSLDYALQFAETGNYGGLAPPAKGTVIPDKEKNIAPPFYEKGKRWPTLVVYSDGADTQKNFQLEHITYEVQRRDTLQEIAKKYFTTPAALEKLNGPLKPLEKGQKIKIPGVIDRHPWLKELLPKNKGFFINIGAANQVAGVDKHLKMINIKGGGPPPPPPIPPIIEFAKVSDKTKKGHQHEFQKPGNYDFFVTGITGDFENISGPYPVIVTSRTEITAEVKVDLAPKQGEAVFRDQDEIIWTGGNATLKFSDHSTSSNATVDLIYELDYGDDSPPLKNVSAKEINATNHSYTIRDEGSSVVKLKILEKELPENNDTDSITLKFRQVIPTINPLTPEEQKNLKVGKPHKFDGQANAPPGTKYKWKFTDPNNKVIESDLVAEKSCTHTFETQGKHQVTFLARLPDTDVFIKSSNYELNVSPSAVLGSATPLKAFQGEAIQMQNKTDANQFKADTTFHWEFSDGKKTLPNQNIINEPKWFAKSGNHSATLIAKAPGLAGKKFGQFGPIKLTIKEIVATIEANHTKVYIGDTIEFDFDKATAPADVNATIQFGDGNKTQPNDKSPFKHFYGNHGQEQKIFKAVLTLNANNVGPVKSEPLSITVKGIIPKPVANVPGGYIGQEIQFKNNTEEPDGLMYKWDFGDGTGSTEKEPKHIYQKAKQPYKVTLTVIHPNPKIPPIKSDPIDVNIQDVVPEPAADREKVFIGGEVKFTHQTDGPPGMTYIWDFGNDETIPGPTATHTFLTPGPNGQAHRVRLLVMVPNVDDPIPSKALLIQVDPIKPAPKEPPDLKPFVGQTIQFYHGTIGPPGLRYIWDFDDGNKTQPDADGNETHHYGSRGPYNATLTVIHPNPAIKPIISNPITIAVQSIEPDFTISPQATEKNLVPKENDNITFTNTTKGPPGMTYTLQYGDRNNTTGKFNENNVTTHSYGIAGEKNVTLHVHLDTLPSTREIPSSILLKKTIKIQPRFIQPHVITIEAGTPFEENDAWFLPVTVEVNGTYKKVRLDIKEQEFFKAYSQELPCDSNNTEHKYIFKVPFTMPTTINPFPGPIEIKLKVTVTVIPDGDHHGKKNLLETLNFDLTPVYSTLFWVLLGIIITLIAGIICYIIWSGRQPRVEGRLRDVNGNGKAELYDYKKKRDLEIDLGDVSTSMTGQRIKFQFRGRKMDPQRKISVLTSDFEVNGRSHAAGDFCEVKTRSVIRIGDHRIEFRP